MNNLPCTANNPSTKQEMVTQHFRIGTHPIIESLQIYTAQLADEFQKIWQKGIDYLRFEWVSLPGDTEKTLSADLILHSTDKKYLITILGILIKKDGIHFPSFLKNWEHRNIAFLCDIIIKAMTEPINDTKYFQFDSTPAIPLSEVTDERMLPGLYPYSTVIAHIKRYNFLSNLILPGKILECACGTGYGATILSRLSIVTEYYGIDLSEIAVNYAKTGTWDNKTAFHAVNLAKPVPHLYENIVSLETIEHVQNPYRFMELLIDKMSPEGQLLISIPIETRHGSHINPYHLSNWNYKRLLNFLEQYFEDITVFTQKYPSSDLSIFEEFDVTDNPPEENNDAIFVSVMRRPNKKKRPNIILRRNGTLGDAIWITPILRELRHLYPSHNLLVSTDNTEAFLHNPDADLVFNTQYEALPDDIIIDLNGAYEARRELHLLHAYSEASGISLTSTQPSLYSINAEILPCATHISHHFRCLDIERLIAVHMAASTPERIWPKMHWQRFITGLLHQDKKLGIVILGHDQDFSATDIGFSTDHRVLCLVRRLSRMHLVAAALSLCDLLVAPEDSEILHIAAATNVLHLGLFSMADPATRLPLTAGSRALWADIECRGCLRDIAPEKALSCPRDNADCMTRILPEEVLAVTAQMLEAVMPGRWKTRCQLLSPSISTDPNTINPIQPPSISPLEQGIQAFNQENLGFAIECLSTAMTQEPDNPLPCAYLAFVCACQGLFQEARDFIAQSTRLAPERADLIAALGEVFLKNGRPSEAAKYLREAVHMQPDLFAAYPALAQSLHLTGQSEEAVSFLQTASNFPSNAQASIRSTLLQILAECGDLSEFTKYAIRFSNGLPDELLAARCLARFDESGEEFLEALFRVQAQFENVIQPSPNSFIQNKSGLTRIAFMVGDFTSHHQLEQLFTLFRYLPPERFFTILISCHTSPSKDNTVHMCALLADTILIINEDEDESAVEKLCALVPDILVNAEVCAPSERLAVFLAVPVPHKLLWADAPIPPISPDVRTLAGERLSVENTLPTVSLPEMGEMLELPELPFADVSARKMGEPPVLGCLVPAAGIARNGWQLFAEALRTHPSATFVINLEELGVATQDFITRQFSSAGIDPARLVFINIQTAEEFCLAWQSIDLGLLPPVNHGGLALPTCLWMGRPCLALRSILPWSQRPAALLKALGKEEWIAIGSPHYADLALQLTPPAQQVKPDPGLRERMKALGFTDAKGFARNFAETMTGLLAGSLSISPDTSGEPQP